MSSISLEHFLVLAAIIFAIGVIGLILKRRNIIAMLMAIELMLLAVNLNFVAFAAYSQSLHGHVLSLFILTIAAAEAGIGLGILVLYFKHRGDITIDEDNVLKG